MCMQKTHAQLPGTETSLSVHTQCFHHKIYFNFVFSFIALTHSNFKEIVATKVMEDLK